MSSQDRFNAAVRSFWDVRATQAVTGLGEGAGGAVRGGQHFNAVGQLLVKPFLDAGYRPSQIRQGRDATLPGYYRPSKNWDLVVVDRGMLVAAIEFKALGGPSFGNNFNNRAEEAIGNASDLWKAYAAGNVGSIRPWLGYVYLIEDAPGSRVRPGNAVSCAVGRVDSGFNKKSYIERAAAMCNRLLGVGLYDAVLFAATSRNPGELPLEPEPALSWAAFEMTLQDRIQRMRKVPASRA